MRKTCVSMTLETGNIDSGYFRLYVTKMEDADGKLHEMDYVNRDGVDSVPNFTNGTPYKWMSLTIACTQKAVSISRGVKVHFIPLLESIPQADLAWWGNPG